MRAVNSLYVTQEDHILRQQLGEAMRAYSLSEIDMARQLGVSIWTIKHFLDGESVPYYVEKLVEEWLD